MTEENEVEWYDSDGVMSIYDKARDLNYINEKFVHDAMEKATNLADFIWALERKYDEIEDELEKFKAAVEKVRKEMKP
jgi:hypothetical protein